MTQLPTQQPRGKAKKEPNLPPSGDPVYEVGVVLKFHISGDTDDVLEHLDKIDAEMKKMLANYPKGAYVETRLV